MENKTTEYAIRLNKAGQPEIVIPVDPSTTHILDKKNLEDKVLSEIGDETVEIVFVRPVTEQANENFVTVLKYNKEDQDAQKLFRESFDAMARDALLAPMLAGSARRPLKV